MFKYSLRAIPMNAALAKTAPFAAKMRPGGSVPLLYHAPFT